ncbi:hypothetical protein [Kineosporia sp. NBRC 101731]|nr:hypothetical protein [Kineosporia sp. NBRC 101731]GLY26994.1 hypothetical protein Kisp02_03590 [Kineosporia sp. NBRC 101731]
MSVVIAVIAVFPVFTLLMIGLAKAENGLYKRSAPADLPSTAVESTVS